MPRLDDDARTRSDPHAFVMRCVAEGVPPEETRRELERNGISPEQARWLVDSAYGGAPVEADEQEPAPAVGREPYSSAVLPQALAAGAAAALVGAIGWTVQVAVTDYETGIVAWAVGGLAGFAVSRAVGNRRGLPLQVIAVASALVGIVLGKYLTVAYLVREDTPPGVDPPAYWDSTLIEFYVENLDDFYGLFDVLFIGFAVVTAWQMLSPRR